MDRNQFRSKLPSPRKLHELSASATNARPRPQEAKGETLVECAGRTTRLKAKTASAIPKDTIGSHHLSSSTRSAAAATSLKPPQYSVYSNSLGPGHARAPLAHNNKSASKLTRSVNGIRPTTALDVHREDSSNGQVLGKRKAWDHEQKVEDMEQMQNMFKEAIRDATAESSGHKEVINLYKARIAELEMLRAQVASNNEKLQEEMAGLKSSLQASEIALDQQKRQHQDDMGALQQTHHRAQEDLKREVEHESQRLANEADKQVNDLEQSFEAKLVQEKKLHEQKMQSLTQDGASQIKELEKSLDAQRLAFRDLEDRRQRELDQRQGHWSQQEKAQSDQIEQQRQAYRRLEEDLERSRRDVGFERDHISQLKEQMSVSTEKMVSLESMVKRLEGHIHFLESDNKSQSQAFADLEQRMQDAVQSAAEANEKLIREETLRRKLHNQVQELKGNIRVFCRVRPAQEIEAAPAKIGYPDHGTDAKEVEVMGPEEKSSLGNVTTRKHAFSFDRVFGPTSQNEDVFAEISQLVQSALDGYNVCIFCYGQTGSGKTHTMSSADGMIPRAVHQIYATAQNLEGKGWKYRMEGSFIEVYNENLNDLLGRAEDFDRKKHEIRHDMTKCKTEVTGIKTVALDSPDRVEEILARSSKNRSVAATQANERSSRSHSVFILRLTGENSVTGERSEGTLNLVDLAGSERLSHSGATGERLKETQNINKSLSCLGDVIGALGQGKDGGHVPYRNSKLTYLLQFSLGGNSKTLMFVMVSPLQAHLHESLTSLKFATKVHNTHIGTARKSTRT